jgi:hypothetical protein
LPPLFYLGLSAVRADRFFAMQDVSISSNSPVSLTSNPVDFQMMSEVFSEPDNLFLDSLALRDIYSELYGGTTADWADTRYRTVKSAAENDLEVRMLGDKTARVSYFGKDLELGQTMVGYYSRRLVQRAQQGFVRSRQKALKQGSSGVSVDGGTGLMGTIGLKGDFLIEAQRALWRPERAVPLVWAFSVSLLVVLVFLGVLEWSDPAFKSERQVARYLGLPILGSLPDLTLVSDALGGKRTGI